MKLFLSLSFIVSSLIATSAYAFELQLPLDCKLGTDCFVQNYVDVDPTQEWKDFSCGRLSYNGHDGTDFRLKDFTAMERGVSVIAVAAGIVTGERDGVEDMGIKKPELFRNKECGNGVIIDHGEGWQTQYCHLKKNSIRVIKGQRVQAGHVLGQVGFSGQTVFPHLHLTVRHNGKVVDPFTAAPYGKNTCGTQATASLWSPQTGLRYNPTALLGAGFTTQVPDVEGVQRGKFNETSMAKNAEFLVAWVHIMGIRAGDMLQVRMTSPDGTVFFSKDEAYANPKATQFNYAGRKREGSVWMPGTYTGSVTLMRGGQPVFSQKLAINVNP